MTQSEESDEPDDTAESMIVGEVNSFKDLFYHTYLGRVISFGAIIVGLVLGYQVGSSHLVKKPEQIEQKQAVGSAKPDVFIERDGVKYFSHVDGKEISDLVGK
ncbi:hypothetical protein HY486_03070 [Candidatus Woesearchaeota archaeon]|nr:hypothetical protein [Candidatus Woesearchaeota archaeon]